MIKKWIGVGAFIVIAAPAALASVFYGVNTNGTISAFDMSAQTVTPLSTIHAGPTSPTGFQDLEFDGSGNLYAIRAYTDFNTFQAFNEVYRVTNANTGNALLSGNIGGSGNPFQSLAYRPSNSMFYSVSAINGYVDTLDVTTGATSPVSGVPNGPRFLVHALAVSPSTGVAYGLIDMGDAIFGTVNMTLMSTNLDTGLSTLIGSLGIGQDSARALRFDDAGNAYTVDIGNGNVCSINLTTGAASVLFAGGAAAMNTTGLAFISVPAPAGAGVLVFGGMFLSRRRR